MNLVVGPDLCVVIQSVYVFSVHWSVNGLHMVLALCSSTWSVGDWTLSRELFNWKYMSNVLCKPMHICWGKITQSNPLYVGQLLCEFGVVPLAFS